MSYRILAINPGSTSTKVALFEDERPVTDFTLRHTSEEIGAFPNVTAQLEWRRSMILDALAKNNIDIHSLSAVIGRGGLVKPIPSGVYEVNTALRDDLLNAKLQHASNLGGLIAEEIAREAGVRAYIADPVVVDEMCDEARYSGIPECPRRSIFHALNQKATSRIYAKKIGRKYEELNLVVAHLGGGISVSAHAQGQVIDTNNALDGDGPFAPERAGTVPAGQLAELCFSGKYTLPQINKMLSGKGGLVAHVGSNSVQHLLEVEWANGNQKAKQMIDAMSYNISKAIGAMAAALGGKVDAVIITGGIAYNEPVVEYVKEKCSFIAPIAVYPGENELESLAMNALMVLRNETNPKIYA